MNADERARRQGAKARAERERKLAAVPPAFWDDMKRLVPRGRALLAQDAEREAAGLILDDRPVSKRGALARMAATIFSDAPPAPPNPEHARLDAELARLRTDVDALAAEGRAVPGTATRAGQPAVSRGRHDA